MTHESQFMDRLCLFMDFSKHFLVRFMSQNIASVRIFIFREIKFLLTLPAPQFAYILLRKLLDCTLFSCIWIAFQPKNLNGRAYSTPPIPPSCWNYPLRFSRPFLERYFKPWNCLVITSLKFVRQFSRITL